MDARVRDIEHRAQFVDWHALEEVWPKFSADLLEHLRFEEQDLFPWFLSEHPDAETYVGLLKDEHHVIRTELETLGSEMQAHVLRGETIERFTRALCSHAARERERFYPWLLEKAQ